MTSDFLETAFLYLSYLPGPFWMILAFFPKNRLAMKAYDAFLVFLTFHFIVLGLPVFMELIATIAKPQFETVRSFIGSPRGFVGAWNHMILGDLWIGRWVVLDAIKQNFHFGLRLPVVVLIMFFGPLGLGAYFILKFLMRRRFFFFET